MKKTIAFLTPIIIVFTIITIILLTSQRERTYTIQQYTPEPCLFTQLGCDIIRIQTESNNVKAFINSIPKGKSCSI